MKRIIQISDIHCGSGYFSPELMEKTISYINNSKPDALLITGDLTTEGFYHEFETALSYINRMEVENKLIVPGNHDARNVGYRSFEKLIGPPDSKLEMGNILICGADSTEPDLDDGQLGRHLTGELKETFKKFNGVIILAMHHHVISVPNSGREMNILRDAGDVLKMAVKSGVNIILSGHKHIPHIWNFEGIKVVTCSTTTSRRIRGIYKPSFNILEIDDHLRIIKKEVEGDSHIIYEGEI